MVYIFYTYIYIYIYIYIIYKYIEATTKWLQVDSQKWRRGKLTTVSFQPHIIKTSF